MVAERELGPRFPFPGFSKTCCIGTYALREGSVIFCVFWVRGAEEILKWGKEEEHIIR